MECDRHGRRPRRIRSRLPRAVAAAVDATFHFVADHFDSYEPRDRILAAQAPIQLILQIVAWLAAFEVGFGLLMWPFVGTAGLSGAFEQAGSALCTLGYLTPRSSSVVALDSLATLFGLGTVALQIGYLPTLYAAFNRREALVTLLDSRAGVPSWGPELLARTHYGLGTGVSAVGELPELFARPTLPLPAYRSRKDFPKIGWIKLKSVSLILSEVGLIRHPLGKLRRLPLASPPMILINIQYLMVATAMKPSIALHPIFVSFIFMIRFALVSK